MGLLEDYIQDCELRALSVQTLHGYLSNVKIYLQFLEKKNIDPLKITNNDLKLFLDYLRNERKNSQRRLENYFSSLSSFYEFLLFNERITGNIILPFRKRYIRSYKKDKVSNSRKLISIEDMKRLIGIIKEGKTGIKRVDAIRDRAIFVLLAKTGIRRGELLTIDVDDVNYEDQSILLKPHPKRSNRLVFFDNECKEFLLEWLKVRSSLQIQNNVKALFIGANCDRLKRGISKRIEKYAIKAGIRPEKFKSVEANFSCHCFRHFWTTEMRRGGMRREFIQELRGDRRREAIDIYDHIDLDELKEEYLRCVPKFGLRTEPEKEYTICEICGKDEILVKGLCYHCYQDEYRKARKEPILCCVTK